VTPTRTRDRHRRRRLLVAATSAVVSLALGGCVVPAHDTGAFRANAVSALSSAVSEARTGALVLRARVDGKVSNAYADTVVTDSESAIGPIEDSFGNVDPPAPGDDRLREDVMSLLGDTADAFAAARLSVRRDDPGTMTKAATELTELADQMDRAKDGLG
jgi:hypothetical protein